ncbi:hypothetical protein [Xanthomonas translucens]|uniref:hypothetical protein n=1 Tax=Xanthomonas campestris pv. translucens TaxID=343 RepID=UPI0018C5967A|nr:hypothetical protein [Xanthomonas translucens]
MVAAELTDVDILKAADDMKSRLVEFVSRLEHDLKESLYSTIDEPIHISAAELIDGQLPGWLPVSVGSRRRGGFTSVLIEKLLSRQVERAAGIL